MDSPYALLWLCGINPSLIYTYLSDPWHSSAYFFPKILFLWIISEFYTLWFEVWIFWYDLHQGINSLNYYIRLDQNCFQMED